MSERTEKKEMKNLTWFNSAVRRNTPNPWKNRIENMLSASILSDKDVTSLLDGTAKADINLRYHVISRQVEIDSFF